MFSLKYSYSCFELQIFRMYCVSHDSGHYISLFILSFAFVWHEITCNTRKAKLFEKDMNVVVFEHHISVIHYDTQSIER